MSEEKKQRHTWDIKGLITFSTTDKEKTLILTFKDNESLLKYTQKVILFSKLMMMHLTGFPKAEGDIFTYTFSLKRQQGPGTPPNHKNYEKVEEAFHLIPGYAGLVKGE